MLKLLIISEMREKKKKSLQLSPSATLSNEDGPELPLVPPQSSIQSGHSWRNSDADLRIAP